MVFETTVMKETPCEHPATKGTMLGPTLRGRKKSEDEDRSGGNEARSHEHVTEGERGEWSAVSSTAKKPHHMKT